MQRVLNVLKSIAMFVSIFSLYLSKVNLLLMIVIPLICDLVIRLIVIVVLRIRIKQDNDTLRLYCTVACLLFYLLTSIIVLLLHLT